MLSTSRFKRGDDYLELQQRETPSGVALAVSTNDTFRSYAFRDIGTLLAFQCDMEQFLVRTGWCLLEFKPDRRQYIDRRSFPRITNDRRRWWTDPQRQPE